MQPIERYGLIALVFLVITIAAACLWDPKDSDKQDGGKPDATAAAAGAAGTNGEPRPRDFVGARTQAHPGQSLSERQRERLQALQQEEASATAPQGDEITAREAALARREAALAAREAGGQQPAAEETQPFKSHLAERAGELFDAASGKAQEVADFVRPDPKTAAATPPATKRTYEVKKGDTLSEIASNELGTWKRWQEIIDANPGLDAEHMRVGARIALPGDAVARGADKSATKAAASADKPSSSTGEKTGATYVVQADDSMWDIAEKTLGDGDRWREIAAANPKVNPDKLLVGQRLSLPSGAASAKPSSEGQRVAQAEAPKQGKVR